MMNRILKSTTQIIISLFCLNNLVYSQSDGFQAEGLTEPIVPERGKLAVKVTFPDDDFYMQFDPPGRAGYVTPEGEILHTYVDSGSPYGEGDWSDEWYYIYPDGVSARVVKIYTGRTKDAVAFWGLPGHCAFWGIRGTVFETQETFIHGVLGLQPTDIIETEVLTLITMDGEYKRISYKTYPPDFSLFDPANIQMVNLKSNYHPFTIVKEGNVEIKPYYMPMDDHRNIDSTMFITWPRRGSFKNGDYTSAISHVIKWGWHEKTEKTLTQIYLIGMIDDPTEQQRVDKLVNWQKTGNMPLN
jgi:hypothetical protein